MDKLWWNHITKAHNFLNGIVSLAIEGRSIILFLPDKVPWKDTLLELVEEKLILENPGRSFDMFQCPEEDVGYFLLRKYCKKETRDKYRYGMTYAAFLGKCEDIVLNDRYVWIYDIPANKYEELLDFIVEYNKNIVDKMPAVFILEMYDKNFASKSVKGISKIIFDHNIGGYDRFAFCTLAVSDNNCKEYMRPYLAELVSTICNEDIELCAECVNAGRRFLENPSEIIRNIVLNKKRSNGEEYTFVKSEEEVDKLIWETQLKNVFPIIEKYRNYFIEKYKSFISTVLPITNSFGESIENPEDVEIGTLIHIIKKGNISLDKEEYEELNIFRKARNKLAHLTRIDTNIVDIILKKSVSLPR